MTLILPPAPFATNCTNELFFFTFFFLNFNILASSARYGSVTIRGTCCRTYKNARINSSGCYCRRRILHVGFSTRENLGGLSSIKGRSNWSAG